MDKKRIFLIACTLGMGLILISCSGMPAKPTEANFKAPMVALESVQVTQYNGFWYYDAKITPVKGKAGANSAMLPMAFAFNITNPNDYPVKLDGFGFTVAFDDFDPFIRSGNRHLLHFPRQAFRRGSSKTDRKDCDL
jgi:hypothetical protein